MEGIDMVFVVGNHDRKHTSSYAGRGGHQEKHSRAIWNCKGNSAKIAGFAPAPALSLRAKQS